MRGKHSIGCIGPLASERKNSQFFGSDMMVRVSAAYHPASLKR